tara:strand:- start:111 stop:347 length:237 start_codon:yes stop_codon:yes gene_type:complete
MTWKRVTRDIAIDYGLWEPVDLRRWENLIIELETNRHTIESLKETDAFLHVVSDFRVTDRYLKKLIQIHEILHEKNDD